MNHYWCKKKKLCRNKLLVKLLYINKIAKLQKKLLNGDLSACRLSLLNPTSYMLHNKINLYFYMFFKDRNVKLYKDYKNALNYSTLNMHVLLSLRYIVSEAGFENKQHLLNAKLHKLSYKLKKRRRPTSFRRRVRAALKKSNKVVGTRSLFFMRKNLLLVWGRYLLYRDRYRHLSLPVLQGSRIARKSRTFSRYVLLVDREAEYEEGAYITPTRFKKRKPKVHRSKRIHVNFLLESSFFHGKAEAANNIVEEGRRAKLTENNLIREQRDQHNMDIKIAAAEKKIAAIQQSRSAREAAELKRLNSIRQSKLAKNPNLVLPEVTLPARKYPAIRVEVPVVKNYTQLFNVNIVPDTELRSPELIEEDIEDDNMDWVTNLAYKSSLLISSSRAGRKGLKVRFRVRRRRFRQKRRVFVRARLRKRKINFKARIIKDATNIINPWLFDYKTRREGGDGTAPTNPITLHNMLYTKLTKSSLWSVQRTKTTVYKHNYTLRIQTSLPYYRSKKFNYVTKFIKFTPNNNTLVYNKTLRQPNYKQKTLLYFLINFVKRGKLNFNNSSLVALLGIIPNSYLRKVTRYSTSRYLSFFYNSNFVLPNLNARKFYRFYRRSYIGELDPGIYSTYAGFLGSIMTNWLSHKIALIVVNLRSFFIKLSHGKLVMRLVRKNIKFHYRIGTGFFLKEAIQVTLLSLALKDPNLFLGWFTKIMEKVEFFKHKKYIMFFKSVFSYLKRRLLRRRFKIKGLYFDIRGKLAVKGNSKKRHILLRYGECTFSQKSIKVKSAYSKVHTFTGVLGVTFILFF